MQKCMQKLAFFCKSLHIFDAPNSYILADISKVTLGGKLRVEFAWLEDLKAEVGTTQAIKENKHIQKGKGYA